MISTSASFLKLSLQPIGHRTQAVIGYSGIPLHHEDYKITSIITGTSNGRATDIHVSHGRTTAFSRSSYSIQCEPTRRSRHSLIYSYSLHLSNITLPVLLHSMVRPFPLHIQHYLLIIHSCSILHRKRGPGQTVQK